ncbi:MAG: Asp-tRNA(Asn)/Glu-tRNA(Gln) amidotransferase subunit GatC [Bifidobacteriaceae bacterium]|jgi:aspartyl-tRNA(Asn)/glutamyl-tRNA(Gln) amidotransferase subunit C|nr:Asp-tRNA(Asn)/Glu-tRNA(Gln) amidotransferase subunit GatC [Bifidobacteriaceae bacterium]
MSQIANQRDSQFTVDKVRHLAELAQIELSGDEIIHLTKELSIITDSINQLADVASSDIKPTSHPVDLCNVLRDDTSVKPLTQTEALSGAPKKQDNMFVAPQILNEE